ncbi:MAG: hypothetical protein ABSA21_09330, partial [Candidatus Limnocylindrales bacterium]
MADGQRSQSAGAIPAGRDVVNSTLGKQASALGSGHGRRFIGLAASCVAATAALFLADVVTAPAAQRPGHLVVAALLAGILLIAFLFLRRGFTSRILVATGAMLIVLGVAVGAFLPDSLDAAVVLPLAGAVLALSAGRGR